MTLYQLIRVERKEHGLIGKFFTIKTLLLVSSLTEVAGMAYKFGVLKSASLV